MDGHIRNLRISTFRGIRNLELRDLGPVNILTGDNNCGKTSVLEVIESLEGPDNPKTWRGLLRRQARVPIMVGGITLYEGFSDLFNINDYDKMIEYDVEMEHGSCHNWKIKFDEKEEQLTKHEIDILKNAPVSIAEEGSKESEEELYDVTKAEISFLMDENLMHSAELYDFQFRFFPDKNRDKTSLAKVRYISPTQHADGNIFLSKVLDDPELYQEMLEVLQEFDPDIISINYVRQESGYGGIYKILAKGQKRALPLNVYGDGMKKAILLMSAAVASKDGILLLDEFETAIHTTAMSRMFAWILRTCYKLNVQLFLTTHSLEALDKVLKCCPELQDEMKVYTLYRKEQEVVVRSLSGRKAIEAKDEMGLELR